MSKIIYDTINLEDLNLIVEERNKCLESLRTSYKLNYEMQKEWFKNEICNRDSRSRFFIMKNEDELEYNTKFNIGYGGIENIQWENRIGEISLLIFENYKNKGFGSKFAQFLINFAFNNLNLNSIFGECYCTNIDSVNFWEKIVLKFQNEYKTNKKILPYRKFWDGKYYDSLIFTIYKENK